MNMIVDKLGSWQNQSYGGEIIKLVNGTFQQKWIILVEGSKH